MPIPGLFLYVRVLIHESAVDRGSLDTLGAIEPKDLDLVAGDQLNRQKCFVDLRNEARRNKSLQIVPEDLPRLVDRRRTKDRTPVRKARVPERVEDAATLREFSLPGTTAGGDDLE